MENKTIIFSGLSLLTGAVVGFVVGYSISKKNAEDKLQEQEEAFKAMQEYQKESELPVESKPVVKTVVKAAKLATPEAPGIDYTLYSKMKAEETKKAESESPSEEDTEEDEEEMEAPMETYEERLEREAEEENAEYQLYQKKKGDKIDVLGNEAVDSEYPEVHYPGEELYYFTEDDIITDEDGNEIDEKSLIGDKLRRFGWMQNEQEAVWVRNNPRETDYHVNKVKDSRDSWFGFDQ